MESVGCIIYEIYDAEINTVHYLDYATMSRKPEETYRNYFNRLVGFVRQHLPKTQIEAEGVKSNGETITIALLDAIAVHWLLSIDRRLISIIKTEFATDLKSKRLCQMIKVIATNIDDLLLRYGNQRDQVSTINNNPKAISTATNMSENSDNTAVDMILRRVERLEQGRSKFSSFRPRSKQAQFRNTPFKKEFCGHCAFLNKQLGSKLDTNHKSSSCGKKKLSISAIESIWDNEDCDLSDYNNDHTESEGDKNFQNIHSNVSLLQKRAPNKILSKDLVSNVNKLKSSEYLPTSPVAKMFLSNHVFNRDNNGSTGVSDFNSVCYDDQHSDIDVDVNVEDAVKTKTNVQDQISCNKKMALHHKRHLKIILFFQQVNWN